MWTVSILVSKNPLRRKVNKSKQPSLEKMVIFNKSAKMERVVESEKRSETRDSHWFATSSKSYALRCCSSILSWSDSTGLSFNWYNVKKRMLKTYVEYYFIN